MAISHKCLSAFILFITFAASYALAPVSPAQDSSIQQPPASLPGSSNLIAPGTSNINPVLQAALGSSDPLAFLRNATQGQLGRPVLHCNGAEYGYNLPFASCIRALTLIPDTTQKLSFGPRTRRQFNFGTPYRLLSNDGLCAVDFESDSNDFIDVARGTDLVHAGQRLVTECFEDNKQGGIVRNLGDREHINMVIRTYVPNVQCSSPSSAFSPTYPDCIMISGLQLPIDKTRRIFGPAGAPLVHEVLPRTITDAYSRRCSLTINTRGPADYATWYDIWAAAVAIDAMCGRENTAGIASGLGESGNLFATMRKV